jgi:hypothetical protein
VLVLGAGLLHDIPLKELSTAFQKVVLLHPLLSRIATWQFRNVELISADVTGVMDELVQIAPIPGARLPISHPTRFINDRELDLTLSVNLLSQIPYVPGKYLDELRDEETIDAFMRHLVEAHLDYLCRLPGHSALITDVLVSRMSRDGGPAETGDPLYGVSLPPADSTWEWHLAPSPEAAPGIDIFTIVAAYMDWKRAVAEHPFPV